jgi:DnaA family protein
VSTFSQLSLGIKLDDQATFSNFYAPRGSNQHLATMLLQDEGQQLAVIIGNSGAGLSHLLQAACQQSPFARASNAIYLPLADLQQYPPEQVLDGLHSSGLVCLDDLQTVSDQANWQTPLFNFFNECKQSGTRMIFASHKLPEDMGIKLPDLASRLSSGLTHRLIDFNDEDLRRLLQFRSNLRGMYMSDEVAKFLLTRLPRDTKTLIRALENIDSASLREQRRLTTPFVKAVLDL